MNRHRFFLLLTLSFLCTSLAVSGLASAQKEAKSWTQWSQKEAEKMLTDSPWSQTQVDTDASQMFFSPTSDPGKPDSRATANDNSRLSQGATNQEVNVKFVVRFFSARPVRCALARLMELRQKPPPEVIEKLQSFADLKAIDSIIVTLSVEATDQRYTANAMQLLNSAVTATLKNDTYLERDGKRLFLAEYVPPGRDGFGARFIFPSAMDQKPFIEANTGEVRFHTKYPKGPTVDRRFKVSEMMYKGELEY
jgi:hypothetical protein